jgi:DNA-binding MarR family transcriptional regulator
MPGDGLPQVLLDLVLLIEARIAQHFRGTKLHWGLRRVLQQLWIADGLSQKELAAAVRISETSMSNMLKHLLKDGWVEKQPDDYDYRISRIILAERGAKLREDVEQELARADAALRDHLGTNDADRLRRLLEQAAAALPLSDLPQGNADAPGIWDRPTPPGEL